MSSCIIVGHPQSGYMEIESLVKEYGMQSAFSSKRDHVSPIEINKTLSKAHGAPLVSNIKVSENIQQINPNSVWNGMALDFMLGNIDQSFWGWSDPQAVFFLDFWKKLDPKTKFILVYDDPQCALRPAYLEESSELTKGILSRHVQNWKTYNEALLHFFHRNLESCLFVHSQEVKSSPNRFIELLRQQEDAPLLKKIETSPKRNISPVHRPSYNEQYSEDMNSVPIATLTDNPVSTYLANIFIQKNQQVFRCYEEIQSVSNLPLDEGSRSLFSPENAFISLISEQKRYLKIEKSVPEYKGLINSLKQNNHTLAAQYQVRNEETLLLKNQIFEVQEEHKKHTQELQLRSQTQQKQIDLLNTQIARNEEKADQISRQSKDLKNQSRIEIIEIKKENRLLLTQLRTVQEELENFYLEHQSAFGFYYGAGDRIKQHLAYRLGATMITNSQSISGWFFMPLALFRETRNFNREKPQRKALNLPRIKQYQDLADAERIQKHLSYRLGRTFIENIHSPIGWIKLPFALRKEVKLFRRSKQAI